MSHDHPTFNGLRWFLAPAALLFTGISHCLISPPSNWTFLHLVNWVPAFWVLSRLRGRNSILAGWVIGMSANLSLFPWIITALAGFMDLPAISCIAVFLIFSLIWGFYVALFAYGFRTVQRITGSGWPFGIAAWFTACEFINPQFFPYYQGVAWYQIPSVFLLTALTGVSGVTFLVILINAIILQAIEVILRESAAEESKSFRRNLVVAFLLIISAIVWSNYRLRQIDRAESEADTVRIALVQTNTFGDNRISLLDIGPSALTADLIDLSEEALIKDENIDVFVWPETAVIGSPLNRENREILRFAKENGVEIWMGASYHQKTADGTWLTYNSAFCIDSRGEVSAPYHKVILVPFGEYVPFAEHVPFLQRIGNFRDTASGDDAMILESGSTRCLFLICYEVIFSGFVRRAVQEDPDILVNLTFDGWYGDTQEPHQHLMLTAVQAAQFGLPLVRCASTGISAFIDARGLITVQSTLYTRDVLTHDVKLVSILAPYTIYGDWFAWGCIIVLAGLFLRIRQVGKGVCSMC